jgi:hypothetical protein
MAVFFVVPVERPGINSHVDAYAFSMPSDFIEMASFAGNIPGCR